MGKRPKKKRNTKVGYLPKLGDFPIYLAEIADRLAARYTFVEIAGEGKTGLACRIKSNQTGRDYCLKTIRESVADPVERNRTKSTLEKEVSILSPLSHRCLPAIYEYDLSGDLPFYISTYHPGTPCNRFLDEGRSFSIADAFTVVLSLLSVMHYVHSQGRTHCDLHLGNVMIHEDVMAVGILVIDFSSGHRDSDTSGDTQIRGAKRFLPTRDQHRFHQTVNRANSESVFQAADFRAVGMLLAALGPALMKHANPLQRIAFNNFHKALQDERIRNWPDATSQLRYVMDPERIINENLDLSLRDDGTKPAIPLPSSNGVPVGGAPLAVINSEAFQRLRGIRQLSFCEFYYPGATHTRFEHSIGVYGMAQRALSHLVNDRTFRESFTSVEVRGFLLAALVHDIGHYPHAHVLEQYAVSRFPGNLNAKTAASHEAHAVHLMERNPELRSQIIERWGQSSFDCASKVIVNKARALSELLDGPMDIDKLDYLSRDAVHCGVKFGDGLDVDGLLRSLRCLPSGGMAITMEGVPMAEGLMILQDQMLSHVYWNEYSRSLICMFHALIAHLVEKDVTGFVGLVTNFKKSSSDVEAIEKYVLPRIARMPATRRDKLMKLATAFVRPRFSDVYTVLRAYRSDDVIPESAITNIYSAIVRDTTHSGTELSQVPIIWKHVTSLRKAFMGAFGEKGIQIDPLQIVIDVPYGKAARRTVLVQRQANAEPVPITEVSHLSSSIFDKPAAYLSPVRVFIDPEILRVAGSDVDQIVSNAEHGFYRPDTVR